MDKEEIIKYCLTLENTYKDCPFSDDFESVTMKHCKNKKWFALLMNVNNKFIVCKIRQIWRFWGFEDFWKILR